MSICDQVGGAVLREGPRENGPGDGIGLWLELLLPSLDAILGESANLLGD